VLLAPLCRGLSENHFVKKIKTPAMKFIEVINFENGAKKNTISEKKPVLVSFEICYFFFNL